MDVVKRIEEVENEILNGDFSNEEIKVKIQEYRQLKEELKQQGIIQIDGIDPDTIIVS